MKKIMALLMTVVMVFSAISIFSVTASAKQKYKFTEMNTFKDVSASHPAKYDIEYMENEGYITGISKKVFDPEVPVTTTDFAEWLCAVLGCNGLPYEIYGGIPVGSEETLTKEEAAQMLHNAAFYRGNDISWIHILTADYTALTDADGNITKDGSGNYLYKESKVTVNTKFFARLIALLRSIFNIFPTVEVKP